MKTKTNTRAGAPRPKPTAGSTVLLRSEERP